MDVTLDELARLVGGTVTGDGKTVIRSVNGIKEAGPGDITFLANSKYAPLLSSTKASAVIVADGSSAPIPTLTCKNPDLAFGRVAEHLSGAAWRPAPGVHPAAVVAATAKLGKNVSIGAGTVIEDQAVVGDNSVLYPQVYVGRETSIGPDALIYPQVVIRERCQVGARVILHSGTVVGADGFGYATDKGVHHKIPQVGIVVIEDDVELGANVTVDRARFGRTVIGKGTKIDNLVQIGHNVVLGRGCLLVSQSGIAGSTKVGNYVVMAGQAGLIGHLEVGDGAIITAQSGVTKDVPPGGVMSGSPSSDRRTHLKELAALSKLPEALLELRKLRQEVVELRKNKTS
ncbi:MAG TPA: UDP-3-O-(3-hydroxymyristoyl)glucosamine N-acyltransferase [Planctomycetota bacterium]|jgi:UDP-3-O-[3-hydroxymyristoyl] glucosamine N-acyltransferase|nr:UDP-3-O-(3-hydroxymyristoyl)glucosamine N-acyltransferase [Planctomycetota bacterium]